MALGQNVRLPLQIKHYSIAKAGIHLFLNSSADWVL